MRFIIIVDTYNVNVLLVGCKLSVTNHTRLHACVHGRMYGIKNEGPYFLAIKIHKNLTYVC